MAFRRRIGSLAELLLRQHLAQQNQEYASNLAFEREQQSKVADLGYAEALKHIGEGGDLGDVPGSVMARLGPVLRMARPSIQDVAGKVGGQIQGAKTIAELPTDVGASLGAAAPKFTDVQGISTPNQDDVEHQKQAQFMQPGAPSDYAFSGASDKTAPSINALMGQRAERERALLMDIQRQAQEKAKEAGMTTHATAMANEAPDVAEAKRTNFAAMTPFESKRAGAVTGAQHAAAFPYEAPTEFYDNDGNLHAYRFGPKGAVEVPGVPPGLSKLAPQRLTGVQSENMASLNTAEVEGVKILGELHNAGLDKSNDPLDPRWERFVVSKLKMDPGDFRKADIVQRTQFIHAAVLRGLMGARPSQYIAQMYQEHVPDASMTGMQLSHVLHNVLQQVGERRGEMENLTGHKPGSWAPTTGMNYERYMQGVNQFQGPEEQSPADSAAEKMRLLRGGR